MIEIENLTFGYRRSERHVFKNLYVKLEENRIYGLLGKNGSGKSTLLYLIAGLLRGQQGKVLYDGIDTWGRKPETLSELFFVPDEFSLPSMSIRQYVDTYSPFYPHFEEDILAQCLADFGMTDAQRMNQLSLGERKKALISFALATCPRLLLMDEPSNGLDIPSKSLFRRMIARYMGEGQTVVISTHQVHDVSTLFDELLVVTDDGCVVNRSLEEMAATTENIEELFMNLTEKTKEVEA